MIRPGPRLLPWALAASSPALLAPLLPGPAIGLAFAAWLVLLCFVAFEAWHLRSCRIDMRRPSEHCISIGEDEALPLVLHSAKACHLRLRQLLPDLLGGGSAECDCECLPGREIDLSLPVQPRARGSVELPSAWLAIRRSGLVERLQECPAPGRLTVLPNLRAIARLNQQLNDAFLRGLGQRMSPRLGSGREFDRLRDYVRGDDYRHIAWKASARRERLIVRTYRLERAQDILVCCDAGHRMAAGVGELSRCDHAVNAAVALAYLANRVEDRIGMLGFADEVSHGVGQGRGPEHLRMLTRFAAGLSPDFRHSDYGRLAAHLRRTLKQRSLIIILTVLPEHEGRDDLLRAMRMLVPRHLPLVCSLVDGDLDARARIEPRDRLELAPRIVAQELQHEREKTCADLRRLGVSVIDSRPEDLGIEAINAYLDIKRRQLL